MAMALAMVTVLELAVCTNLTSLTVAEEQLPQSITIKYTVVSTTADMFIVQPVLFIIARYMVIVDIISMDTMLEVEDITARREVPLNPMPLEVVVDVEDEEVTVDTAMDAVDTSDAEVETSGKNKSSMPEEVVCSVTTALMLAQDI